jgi:hypothetical protein
MAELVTLEQARTHLRTDSDADDAWLELMITVVSAAVFSWLKDEWRAYVPATDAEGNVIEDSNGDPIPFEDSNGYTVKPLVAGAVLVELAQQYRFRDGSDAAAVPSHWGHGYILGAGATSLLSGSRKSTLA